MLGELLLRAGVITEEQLRKALAEQKKWGGKLGQVLVDLNFLDEGLLVKALSKQLNLPRMDFEGITIPPEALELLDAEFANKRQVLPVSFDKDKKQLVVAMSDPGDLGLVDEIKFKTGCRIKVAVAGDRALARAIQQYYFAGAASWWSF
jgi:type IV pilus assembly protein PilB